MAWRDEAEKGVSFLSDIPSSVPNGKRLLHNINWTGQPLNKKGFRAWLEQPDDERQDLCGCRWANHLPFHYRRKYRQTTVRPDGIGGWLILLALQTLISPLWFLKDIIEALNIVNNATGPINKDAGLNFAFALAVDIGFVAGWIVAIVFLFQHKRAFPKLWIAMAAASCVLNLASVLLTNIPPSQADIRGVVRPLMNLALWGTYLLVSKRVQNTFVN